MGHEVDQGGPAANGANVGEPAGDGASRLRVDGLSPKQEQGVIALLSQPTIKTAAESLGMAERTFFDWLAQPAFKRAYREARREAFSHAISLCQKYSGHAVRALVKVATDGTAPHAAVVSAAMGILKIGREGIELDDVVARVEALEQAAANPRPLGLAS